MKSSSIYFDRTRNGANPDKRTGAQLLEAMGSNAHFHFPIYGTEESSQFSDNYRFIQVVKSPGSAFVVRDMSVSPVVIITTVLSCWPVVLLVLEMVVISGIVIWMAVSIGYRVFYKGRTLKSCVEIPVTLI